MMNVSKRHSLGRLVLRSPQKQVASDSSIYFLTIGRSRSVTDRSAF